MSIGKNLHLLCALKQKCNSQFPQNNRVRNFSLLKSGKGYSLLRSREELFGSLSLFINGKKKLTLKNELS